MTSNPDVSCTKHSLLKKAHINSFRLEKSKCKKRSFSFDKKPTGITYMKKSKSLFKFEDFTLDLNPLQKYSFNLSH
jgi:hypothetical protein